MSLKRVLMGGAALSILLACQPALADDVSDQIAALRRQIDQQNQQIREQEKLLKKLEASVNQSKAQAQQAQSTAVAARAAASTEAQQAQKDAAAALQIANAKAPASPSGFALGPNFGDIQFGDNALHIGGKLQADLPLVAQSNAPSKLGSAANIRRMYVDLRGSIGTDWDYRLEFGTSSGALNVAWADVVYKHFAPFTAMVGYQKTYFSLDNQTADESRIFTEAPLPSSAFVSSKQIGVSVADYGTWWQAGGGIFNGSATTAPAAGVDNGWQASGRAVVFPINRDGMTLEFGGSLANQRASSASTYSFKTVPEENVVATSLVSTGTIANANNQVSEGVEGSFGYGPVLLQGEWIGTQVHHDVLSKATPQNPFFSGWYAQASWVLTGETHKWDPQSASYKGIDPAHPLGPDGFGAFELAGRFSQVNLTDFGGVGKASAALPQGREQNMTFAANWYFNKYLRAELDWTHIFPLHVPTGYAGNLNGVRGDIVEVRTQLTW